MNPVIKEIAKETKGKAKVLKVDIDRNPEITRKLDVMGVPTFIIYKNGKVVWRRSGGMTKTKLLKELEKHYN